MYPRASPHRARESVDSFYEMRQEESSEIEPEPLERQPVGSTLEPSPKLKPETLEEEDSLPPEFLRSIEYDLFEDFGNTS